MDSLPESATRIRAVLRDYIAIHDDIFKPSIRKTTDIPGLFYEIDFERHAEYLGVLADELDEAANNFDSDASPILEDYNDALLQAINELKYICEKLFERSQGEGDYSMEEYQADVVSYQDSAETYMELGKEFNQYLTDKRRPDDTTKGTESDTDGRTSGGTASGAISGISARRPKSYIMLSHIVHIAAGLLFPGFFLWTKSGIFAAAIFSLLIQGIDQIRLYLHYQREFQLIEEANGVKGRSTSFELSDIFRHAQVLILKILWYGMITMVCARIVV